MSAILYKLDGDDITRVMVPARKVPQFLAAGFVADKKELEVDFESKKETKKTKAKK
jgi:hypothetical protein